MAEKTVSYLSYFDRERLKKILLLKSDEGNYCARIKTLDRDSLEIHTGQMFFSPETLRFIMGMAMQSLGEDAVISLAYKKDGWKPVL